MAGRGRTSYQKKQKEQLRLERRQEKVAKKAARKTTKGSEPEIAWSEATTPFPDDQIDIQTENRTAGD
jgi:hypothetical protein